MVNSHIHYKFARNIGFDIKHYLRMAGANSVREYNSSIHIFSHVYYPGHQHLWYGNGFLRITHAVSRRQELAADALAARVAGRSAMARALRTIHGAGDAFGFYWSNEVVPAISRGLLRSSRARCSAAGKARSPSSRRGGTSTTGSCSTP